MTGGGGTGNLAMAPAQAPNPIAVENVSLSYGTTRVLRGIDLAIRPGELFSFLGPSGCGKTTLLRLIAGFARADTGRVLIGGQDVSGLPPWKRDVGLVFQSYALWPHMTVARNVAFGLEERRVPSAEIAPRVRAALELVGLSHLAGRRPSELSGGQQQRVALARTIVVRPKVLLLDEPLSNLDARLRVEVRRELRALQSRLGITTIFVTHDQEEANTISDRIAVMHEGVVQQVGTPMELYARPANLFVAGFLGTANVLEGRLAGEGASRAYQIGEGVRIPVPAAITVPADARLVLRPQAIRILDGSETAPDGGTTLAATVTGREFHGASVRYTVAMRSGQSLLVDLPFRAGAPLREAGDAVTLAIPPDALCWV